MFSIEQSENVFWGFFSLTYFNDFCGTISGLKAFLLWLPSCNKNSQFIFKLSTNVCFLPATFYTVSLTPAIFTSIYKNLPLGRSLLVVGGLALSSLALPTMFQLLPCWLSGLSVRFQCLLARLNAGMDMSRDYIIRS